MSKKQIFFSRLLSTVVLWGLVLGAVLSGSEIGCMAVLCGLGIIGLWEYFAGVSGKGLPVYPRVGKACGVVILIGTYLLYSGLLGHFPLLGAVATELEIGLLVLCVLVILTTQLFQKTLEPLPLTAAAFTLFGVIYVAWSFSFVTKIIYHFPRVEGHITGHWYVLFLCVVSKFSDMGAYLTGSLIGKHKMIPHISPGKTWEGFGGALLFSLGGSFALCGLLGAKLGAFSRFDAAVLGLGLGLTAVIGDLAESVLKRSLELKDSGRMLPGIGGSLDLIDSVLFTGPLLYCYVHFSAILQ